MTFRTLVGRSNQLPVAQWLEHPTGVRKVMGSIPVGDSDFSFVPRSRYVDYSIFFYWICFLVHDVGKCPKDFGLRLYFVDLSETSYIAVL